jgi:mRNA deadenylase 3'-5' endonuclease subunit Ccr4
MQIANREADRFCAVSYNILANAYVVPDRYPLSSADDLEPVARRQRLLTTIRELDADLFCLQEVEADAHAEIATALGHEFESALALRPGRSEGCASYWRRDRFELEGHELLHYRASDGDGSQLALLVRFRRGQHRLLVANTHLRWQPHRTAIAEHVGRQQLLELLALREREHTTPWIIAGDFNATADSPVVAAALERGFELGCRALRPWDTTNINGRCRKLDYLLYSKAELIPKPSPQVRLERNTPMPSRVHASDHLPIRVEFVQRRPGE